ncbi:fumarylacetoacetate hydrolase family protein [Parvularcula marina]|uniref:fumarylacetoacetate hydrolase family protein n=1 Tax=Parvularcula marina TaxID=2292771 RepID=UPI0035168D51
MSGFQFNPADDLPADWRQGLFAGRIDRGEGPTPVIIRGGHLFDVAAIAPTVSELMEMDVSSIEGIDLGDLEGFGLSPEESAPFRLLAPIDLQCVKAAGVTFAVSTLERVIEERARGDASGALAIRQQLENEVGSGLQIVVPGTEEAAALKSVLIEAGLWSQYLEVAIGPDAEIFTKAPVLSSVGWGQQIGVRSDSHWNNPEPEVVLAARADGTPLGAMLGNDVNLRDFEGRSALLLSKAKDNNASCSLGPFIRLFDEGFTLDDVRAMDITLRIEGPAGFTLEGVNSMSQISRDPTDLLKQCLSQHQYPDGFVLFLGTMFAPTEDRGAAGEGFTHKMGDKVSISSARLGRLINQVTTSKEAAPWRFGIRGLMANLAARGLLTR